MSVWNAALKARELFVGLRLGFDDPGAPMEVKAFNAGDGLQFTREGANDLEGRVLHTNSKGVAIEVTDTTRWLMTPVTYSEKRRAKVAERTANVWIVRERLP